MNSVKLLFKRSPIIANSIAGFLTFAAGDVFSQQIEYYARIQRKHASNNVSRINFHFISKCIDTCIGTNMFKSLDLIKKLIDYS